MKKEQDQKDLQEFIRKFNELRRQFPNVEVNSESGFEAVEFSLNNEVECIPCKIEKL